MLSYWFNCFYPTKESGALYFHEPPYPGVIYSVRDQLQHIFTTYSRNVDTVAIVFSAGACNDNPK